MRSWMERAGERTRQEAKELLLDESGMGTVEIILIIVVLVGLVVIFRRQMSDLVNKIFNRISTESGQIIGASFSGWPFL